MALDYLLEGFLTLMCRLLRWVSPLALLLLLTGMVSFRYSLRLAAVVVYGSSIYPLDLGGPVCLVSDSYFWVLYTLANGWVLVLILHKGRSVLLVFGV